MCKFKQNVWKPQSNQHKENTACNNIGGERRNSAISCPACWIFNVTNFYNFQIIHSSNQTISLSNKYKSKKSFVDTLPNNSSFSQKRVNRWNSCQTYHQNSPSHCNSCGTSVLTFQIPKILRSGKFLKRWSNNFSH